MSPARKPSPGRKSSAKNRRKTVPKKKKGGKKTAPAPGSMKPALVFLALAGILVAGLYLFVGLEKPSPGRPNGKPDIPRPVPAPKTSPGRPVIKIYLPEPGSSRLRPTLIRFNQPLAGTRRARAIIRELSRSRPETIPPLPAGTRLLEARFQAPLITINLSRELSAGLKNSGAEDEIAAVTSLTNSFLASFPGFSRLQILIDGRRQKTLAGHIDISRPLQRISLHP